MGNSGLDCRHLRRIINPILRAEDRAAAIRHETEIEESRHVIARRERFPA
jgi:hypothetical protein